jgi:transposase InsO family protein
LSKNEIFIGNGYSCNGLFKLSIINKVISHFSYTVELSSLWHGRLAHLNFKYLKYMSKHGLISYKHDNNEKCEICIQAKMTKKPFPTIHINSQILELIHSDICELNGILTRGGRMYFFTFINNFSRYTYVYLMKNKDEAFRMFKRYKYEVENKKEKKIKILRTDRGGEYFPHEFSTFCEEHEIVHQKSVPYTPQQNGLVKEKIGHL